MLGIHYGVSEIFIVVTLLTMNSDCNVSLGPALAPLTHPAKFLQLEVACDWRKCCVSSPWRTETRAYKYKFVKMYLPRSIVVNILYAATPRAEYVVPGEVAISSQMPNLTRAAHNSHYAKSSRALCIFESHLLIKRSHVTSSQVPGHLSYALWGEKLQCLAECWP